MTFTISDQRLSEKYKKRLKIAKLKVKQYKILQVLTLGIVRSFTRKKKKYRDEIKRIEEIHSFVPLSREVEKYKDRLKIAKRKVKQYKVLQVLTLGIVKSFTRKKKKYRDEIKRIGAQNCNKAMRSFEFGRESMIMISHDAHYGGATVVALRLAFFLRQYYGFFIHFLLYQGGPKLDEFHEHGAVHLLDIDYVHDGPLPGHVEQTVASLAQNGVSRVIANTVISGSLTKLLKQHGMTVISLVHEMPQLMKQMNLLKNAEELAEYSDAVIFGGSAVRNAFPFPEKLSSEKTFVIGQGAYQYSTPFSREEARARLRAQLGISGDSHIILGCGYAEPRKGVDLFADVLARLANDMQNVFFVWLGNADPAYIKEIQQNLQSKQLAERFIVLDRFENDPSLYFCGADIFFLSSREDPFPTVVIEAMRACLPAAAFADAGGAEEMLGEGRGIIAKHLDVEDMAEKLKHFLRRPDFDMVQRAHAYARDFTYERYASRILTIFRAFEYPDKGLKHNSTTPYLIQAPAPAVNAKRILHIIGNFHMGGSSQLIADIIEGVGPDYQHHIITQSNPFPYAYLGATVEELPLDTPDCVFRDRIDAFLPDCIHIHYWGSNDISWYSRVFENIAQVDVPVIQNVNTPIEPYESPVVTKNVFVSRYTEKTFGKNNAKNLVIYPGVDFDHYFRHADILLRDKSCVGMVYRLDGDKITLESFDPLIALAMMRPSITILIVGAGALLEQIKAKIADAGVADQFTFVGYVPFCDLPYYYSKMSVFLAPVVAESFGQVTPIAMAFQLPVVAYDVGTLGEILDTPSSLVPLGHSVQFAEKVLELLDDPQKCEELGRKYKERAIHLFSLQTMISAYQQLYDDVITENRTWKKKGLLGIKSLVAAPPQASDNPIQRFLLSTQAQRLLCRDKSGSYPSILLILHELSLTGAPVVGVQLAQTLAKHYGVAPVILSLRDGPLKNVLECDGMTVIIHENHLSAQRDPYCEKLFCRLFDAVIVNSLASSMFLQNFDPHGLPMSWWIHESAEGFHYAPPVLPQCFDMMQAVWWGSPNSEHCGRSYITEDKATHLRYGAPDRSAMENSASQSSGEIVFGVIGSLIPRKGQDIFLSALARLSSSVLEKARFVIVGEPYEPDMWPDYTRAIFKKMEQFSNIDYHRTMSNDDYLKLLASLDVLICPSTDDPMPVVVTEALMFSKLCVISDAIGQARLLNHEEAMLVPTGSPEALADAIRNIVSRPELITNFSAPARAAYERFFSMEQFESNAIRLVNKLLLGAKINMLGCQLPVEDWLMLNSADLSAQPELRQYVGPFPPAELMRITSGLSSEREFADHGVAMYRALSEASCKPLPEFMSILDFGCGAGRLARMFKGYPNRFAGCDIDKRLVDWMQQAMPNMQVKLSNPYPPVPFDTNEFEAIISISIFTHLTERSQDEFLQELHRICKPGGRLFITIHGERALERATKETAIKNMLSIDGILFQQAQLSFAAGNHSFIYQDGHLTTVSVGGEKTYSPDKAISEPFMYGITFIPQAYIQNHWGQWFEIEKHVSGAIHDFQDIVVLIPKK